MHFFGYKNVEILQKSEENQWFFDTKCEKWIVSQHDIGEKDGIRLWPVYCLPVVINKKD